MRRLLALLIVVGGLALAQAQNFTMPPPGGVVVIGAQVVSSCGTQSLAASPAIVTIDATGKLCVNSGGAGTQVVSGTVSISGTTPVSGTVAISGMIPGQRFLGFAFSCTPSILSYTQQTNICGLQPISTGLSVGTSVTVFSMRSILTANSITAAGSIAAEFFNASPSSSFSDGTSTTILAADASKYAGVVQLVGVNTTFISAATFQGVSGGGSTQGSNWTTSVDASGNIYVAVMSVGTTTTTSPTHWNFVGEIHY